MTILPSQVARLSCRVLNLLPEPHYDLEHLSHSCIPTSKDVRLLATTLLLLLFTHLQGLEIVGYNPPTPPVNPPPRTWGCWLQPWAPSVSHSRILTSKDLRLLATTLSPFPFPLRYILTSKDLRLLATSLRLLLLTHLQGLEVVGYNSEPLSFPTPVFSPPRTWDCWLQPSYSSGLLTSKDLRLLATTLLLPCTHLQGLEVVGYNPPTPPVYSPPKTWDCWLRPWAPPPFPTQVYSPPRTWGCWLQHSYSSCLLTSRDLRLLATTLSSSSSSMILVSPVSARSSALSSSASHCCSRFATSSYFRSASSAWVLSVKTVTKYFQDRVFIPKWNCSRPTLPLWKPFLVPGLLELVL